MKAKTVTKGQKVRRIRCPHGAGQRRRKGLQEGLIEVLPMPGR